MKSIESFSRVITLAEKEAYQNLQLYDSGIHDIKNIEKIKKILNANLVLPKYNPKILDITQQEIDAYIHFAQILNL